MSSKSNSDVQTDLQVISAAGSWQPVSVQEQRVLGSGRAAKAVLVDAIDASGQTKQCVEKIFRPGLLTRTIYRSVYQSSFPYQTSSDAILACYYRRRVASKLLKAVVPDVRIAEPLYVRWSSQVSAYVLGAEFVAGRGIKPAPASPNRIRSLFGSPGNGPTDDNQPEEIEELLDVMQRVETMLGDAGLVGSGWQVCQQAIVSTANLLRTPDGYVVVDLESGIPAMLVAHYIKAGLKIRSLPLFDDIDPDGIREYLSSNESELKAALGDSVFQELQFESNELIKHSVAWKQSEVSIFRQGLPFIGRQFQNQYREKCVQHWHRTGVIDDETHLDYQRSSRLYTRSVYWLGLIPSSIGRGLQRLRGNRDFRSEVGEFLRSKSKRQSATGRYLSRKSIQFSDLGRIAEDREFTRLGPSYITNWVMSKLFPSSVHRWFSDPARRRYVLTRILLLVVSSRFQREFGKLQIQAAINDWQNSGRIDKDEQAQLMELCQSQAMDEYARCFGLHLSIKLISPLLLTAKVGGVAAFMATGNLTYLVPMAISPALRTVITLVRMIQNAGRGTAYGEALLIGLLPVVGTLAFPIQLYSSSPKLSIFLIRDAAARLSRLFPIYGGKDSRLKIAAIKAADLPIEMIEAVVKSTSAIRKRIYPSAVEGSQTAPSIHRLSRWDGLANEQLQLCRVERFGNSEASQADTASKAGERLRAA